MIAEKATNIQETQNFESTVIVKAGRVKVGEVQNSKIAEEIIRAYNLKRELEAVSGAYDEAKSKIVNFARNFLDKHTTINFEVKTGIGTIHCKVTFQYEGIIDPEHISKVKEVLKEKFNALVRTKVKYTATKRLMELLCSADEPIAELLRPYIAIKEYGRSVQFKLK